MPPAVLPTFTDAYEYSVYLSVCNYMQKRQVRSRFTVVVPFTLVAMIVGLSLTVTTTRADLNAIVVEDALSHGERYIGRRFVFIDAVGEALLPEWSRRSSLSFAPLLYWRTDGTAGGTWTSSFWSNPASATGGTGWTSGNDAQFSANSTLTYVSGTSIGNVTVDDGVTVTVTTAGTLPTGTHIYTVGSGSTLTWVSQAISAGASSFDKEGAGTWNLGSGGSNSITGGFILGGGTVIGTGQRSFGAGPLTINGGTIQTSGGITFLVTGVTVGGNFIFAGTGNDVWNQSWNLGSTTRTITNNTSTVSTATRTFSNTIGGSGGLTFSGTGGSGGIVLSGANTFSGPLTVNGGLVTLSNSNSHTGNTVVNGGYLNLIGSATLPNTALIEIGDNAIFDVQSLSTPLTLTTNQNLKLSAGANTATLATSGTKGLITGASSQLHFSAYNGSTPPLTVAGPGSLTLALGNVVSITPSTMLGAAGSPYKLIAKGTGNTNAVNGTLPVAVPIVNAPGICAGCTASLAITGGELLLTVTAPVAPTTQASNVTFSSVTTTAMTVNWANGDGTKRIVKINTANSFTPPVNGTDPSANAVYSGSGEQVVYNNSGGSVAVSNLIAGTTYWFRVYEANGAGSTVVFNTANGTNNPNSQTTSPATTTLDNLAVNATESVGNSLAVITTLTRTSAPAGVVSGATVAFTLNGPGGSTVLTTATNAAGLASVSFPLTVKGAHTVVANFAATSTLAASASNTPTVNVYQRTSLAFSGGSGVPGSPTTLNATLTQLPGNTALAGQTVTFNFGGTPANLSATTDASGVATVTPTFPSTGTFSTTASFSNLASFFADSTGALVATTATANVSIAPNNPPSLSTNAGSKLFVARYNTGNFIARANVDGTGLNTTHFALPNNAIGVTVDTVNGKLYWSSFGGGGSIGRMNLDGSGAEPNFVTGVNVIGMAVDTVNGWLYLADGAIKRVRLDGTGLTTLIPNLNIPGTAAVDGIALDVPNNKLYYAFNTHIGRADLDGTSHAQNYIATSGGAPASGLAIDRTNGKLYWTIGGASGKIGRANVDGTAIESTFLSVAFPRSLIVDPQASKVFWSDGSGVGRANLDGTNVNSSFLTVSGSGVFSVGDVDVETTPATRSRPCNDP